MKNIGEITLDGKIIITDPCYEPDIWCTVKTELPKARYNCKVLTVNKRNASLIVMKKSFKNKGISYKYIGSAGVDSGQLGIFDLDYFIKHQPDDDWENEKSWYRKVSEATINPGYTLTDKAGVCSSTYCGDGMYPVYEILNDGKVIGIRVNFIEE